MLLRELAVAARRFCSRALAAKVHASAGAVAHMAHGATGSIEKPALLAGNERVLAAFAVQALRALARAAVSKGKWSWVTRRKMEGIRG